MADRRTFREICNVSGVLHTTLLLAAAFSLLSCFPEKSSILTQADDLFDRRMYREAIGAYDLVLSEDPRNVEALTNRGTAKYAVGDLQGAIEDYSAALRFMPGSLDHVRMRAEVRVAMVKNILENPDAAPDRVIWALDRLSALVLAMDDCSKILARDPEDVEVRRDRGFLEMELGDLVSAEQDFTRVLKAMPGDCWSMNQRGRVRFLRGDDSLAIVDFTSAIAVCPDDAAAFYNRGVAELRSGRFWDSVKDLSVVLALDETDGWAYLLRGSARWHSHQSDSARADFQRASDLGVQSAVDSLLRYFPDS